MDKKELETLAEINMLRFTDAEYAALQKRFDETLAKCDVLLSADTKGLSIHPEPVGLETLADDVPHKSLTLEQVFKDAPQKRDRYFVVPKVME